MDSQRVLIIIFILSWCGLLIADPRHTTLVSSAVTRIQLTILPKVEVARVHEIEIYPEQVAEAHSDTLCLTSNGITDYSVTAEGRSDMTLDPLSNTEGICSDPSNIAYALDIPFDNADSADFGNQLTLMVSAE